MRERVAALDMLRGLAAVSVAIPHFYLYLGTTHLLTEAFSVIAVEIFFVLSGFVLAPQIMLVLTGRMAGGLRTFLVRRWMRTVPPYAVAVVMVSVLFQAIGTADFWQYLFYVQNLFGQTLSKDYYSVAWSLSVEEWFYIVFPVFLLIATLGSARSQAYYAAAALAFILIIFAGRTIFGDTAAWGSEVRRVVAFRVDSIAFGFLLYLGLERLPPLTLRAVPACLAAALALVYALYGLLQSVEASVAAQMAFPFVAAAFGASCICLFQALEPLFRGPLLRRVADVAGKTSYAVYLFHLLPAYLVANLDLSVTTKLGLFIAATAALATVSSYLLEQPVLEMRPRYREKGPIATGQTAAT